VQAAGGFKRWLEVVVQTCDLLQGAEGFKRLFKLQEHGGLIHQQRGFIRARGQICPVAVRLFRLTPT
jgi:hypothetical protein